MDERGQNGGRDLALLAREVAERQDRKRQVLDDRQQQRAVDAPDVHVRLDDAVGVEHGLREPLLLQLVTQRKPSLVQRASKRLGSDVQ